MKKSPLNMLLLPEPDYAYRNEATLVLWRFVAGALNGLLIGGTAGIAYRVFEVIR